MSLNGGEAPVLVTEFDRASPRLPSTAEKCNLTAMLFVDEWTDWKFIVATKERTALQIFQDVHWAKITILAQAQAVFSNC